MVSDRILRRIERLLDQADEAADGHNWDLVRELARRALVLDEVNEDAHAYLAMAAEELGADAPGTDADAERPQR
jgi:hypothetical protein